MDLVASFESQKIKTFQFFKISGILNEDILTFLFDTGAACSVVGINSFMPPESKDGRHPKYDALKEIVLSEIDRQGISERENKLKTADSTAIRTYPCVSSNVRIEGAGAIRFYFDIAVESDISIPLLGSNFADDCNYSHKQGGTISVSSMKSNPGSDFYEGLHPLDFDIVKKCFMLEAGNEL